METTEQVEQRLCYCHQETIGGVLCNVISAGCKLHGVKSAYGERNAYPPMKMAKRSGKMMPLAKD